MLSNTVPPAAYEIAGKRWPKDAPGFSEAIAYAFEHHLRPRCLCRKNLDGKGIEMYVARLMDGYIVKRMPNTGNKHDISCSSYEPPHDFTGPGQMLGTAINENPATGETTLKLDFPLTKMPGRRQTPTAGGDYDSVANEGSKLSLRGLLHYLWDQAELTRWQPGFEGRRTWSIVRRLLLRAAGCMITKGEQLSTLLYIPEVFSVDQRAAINSRRLADWAVALPSMGKPQHLILMIAEVKEIASARCPHSVIVRHVPDQAFGIDEMLLRRIDQRLNNELAIWRGSDSIRMVMICTFLLTTTGVPAIVELSLMPVTPEWLPIHNSFDQYLVARLVQERRSFLKSPRCNKLPRECVESAVLLDVSDTPCRLSIWAHVDDVSSTDFGSASFMTTGPQQWNWKPSRGPMPALPARGTLKRELNQRRDSTREQHHPSQAKQPAKSLL